MAPSAVNDGVRGLMAAAAKYRDDVSGAMVTGGSGSAYTLSTNQGFTAPIADGTGLAFWAHATNAAGATLNVDGTGVAPFMAPINVTLQAGVLVAGTPYRIRYSTTPGWVIEGVFGGPYAIPIGAFMPYLSTSPPTSHFVLPFGQAINRATYTTLFAMIGTTFGVGDGSSTFNIPDLRGRVVVGQDNMGGPAIGRVTSAGSGVDGTLLGASGGSQNKTLLRSDLPNVAATVAITDPGHVHQSVGGNAAVRNDINQIGAQVAVAGNTPTLPAVTGITAIVNLNGGVTQTQVNGLPPSIVLPFLLRVI
jgi:microcystin-dependent protein